MGFVAALWQCSPEAADLSPGCAIKSFWPNCQMLHSGDPEIIE